MVTVIGSVYQGPDQDGDFGWMIKQPKYSDAFFIFNDNQTEFLAHQNHPNAGPDGPGCNMGGGNAVIRPYQCKIPPQAGGIPTGEYGIPGGPGYPALTEEVKGYIKQAIASIKQAVEDNNYSKVIFSSDGHGGLGHGIFDPCEAVKDYIVQEINNLAN
ncbi:MAG: hypothetical protein AAF557_20955 [Pseudomonadota bacterium]